MTCKKLKNNIILLLVIIYTFLTCSQTCKASWSTEQIDFVKSKLPEAENMLNELA